MKRRALFRTGLVLLAAGLVIAVTWARFTPYDTAAEMAADVAAAQGQTPAPGVEALLRRSIAKPPPHPSHPGRDATNMGPLQSIAYLGRSPWILGFIVRQDAFLATYRNGTLIWRVNLKNDGTLRNVAYLSPEPMTPGQIIEDFSTLPARFLAFPIVLQLVSLLVLAVIGRYVLRIRL